MPGLQLAKKQPEEALNFVFTAFVIAALASTAMQLAQFLQLVGDGNMWLPDDETTHFSANLRQPNQLGSLLLLGVCGVTWIYANGKIRARTTVILVSVLLFGTALTQSRAAVVNVGVLWLMFSLFWNNPSSRPAINRWIAVLASCFFALFWTLPFVIARMQGLDSAVIRGTSSSGRLEMWKTLVPAVLDHPFTGYGWGQTVFAAIARINDYHPGGVTYESHNIVLDLLLYVGLPLGGLIVVFTAWRMTRIFKNARNSKFIISFVALCLLLVHAMLELPLHYGYFLFPFFLIFGILEARDPKPAKTVTAPKFLVFFTWALLSAGFLATSREYFILESAVQAVKSDVSGKLRVEPDLFFLSQWGDTLKLIHLEPEVPLSVERRAFLVRSASTVPVAMNLFRTAENLALAGEPEEAQHWLTVVCKFTPPQSVAFVKKQWAAKSTKQIQMQNVNWHGCKTSS